MNDDKTLSTSLAVMRFSLAAFLLVWVFQKILVPQGAAGVFKGFYGATLGETIVMGLGVAQLAIVAAFAAGLFKTWTYGAVVLMNLASLLVAAPRLMDPYKPPNALFWASVPVLAASIALFLLRNRDTTATVER